MRFSAFQTILVLLLWALTLTVKDSYRTTPMYYLELVKKDLDGLYRIPLYEEIIMYDDMRPLGMALSMGSYSPLAVIGINKEQWRALPHEGRKKLLLHEFTHCVGVEKFHCNHSNCVMFPFMATVRDTPYDTLLKYTKEYHYGETKETRWPQTKAEPSRCKEEGCSR